MEIEAVLERMMLGAVCPDAEVPFADHTGRVALRLQRLGNRDLGGGQAAGGDSTQDPELVVRHASANRVTPSQKRGAARGADFGGYVELREPGTFGRHLVQVGGPDRRVTVAA